MKRRIQYQSRQPRVRPRWIRQYRGPAPPGPLVNFPARLPISTATRTDQGMSMSSTGTRTKQKYRSRTGVTNQHDYSLIYRKKSMPWRKRKRWTGFLRKNLAADMQLLGTKTFVYNYQLLRECNNSVGDSVFTTLSVQDNGVCHLYGFTTAAGDAGQIQLAEMGYRDVHNITNSLRNAPSGSVNIGAFNSSKLVFGSAVLDITFTCLPEVQRIAPGTEEPVSFGGGRLEIDVYEIVYRKTTVNRAIHGFRLMQDSTLPPITDAPLSGYDAPNYLSRGWTPFDNPQALSQYGIKILKKTKYFVSPNTSVTYQIRDARNRYLDLYDGLQDQGLARRGWTRTVFISFKCVTGEIKEGRLAIGCTRKYMLKVNKSGSTDQTNALNASG